MNDDKLDKVIHVQMKLMKFGILPGILGGIACFIGPPHSALLKSQIGVVIGMALQHRFIAPVFKEAMKAADEFTDELIDNFKP